MEKLSISKQERELLKSRGISYDYDALSDDDLFNLDEKMGDLLVYEGLDDDNEDNWMGRIYRGIIWKICDLDNE